MNARSALALFDGFKAELQARPDGRSSDICLRDLFPNDKPATATREMIGVAEEWSKEIGKKVVFLNIPNRETNPLCEIGHFKIVP